MIENTHLIKIALNRLSSLHENPQHQHESMRHIAHGVKLERTCRVWLQHGRTIVSDKTTQLPEITPFQHNVHEHPYSRAYLNRSFSHVAQHQYWRFRKVVTAAANPPGPLVSQTKAGKAEYKPPSKLDADHEEQDRKAAPATVGVSDPPPFEIKLKRARGVPIRKQPRAPALRKQVVSHDTKKQGRKAATATADVPDPPPVDIELEGRRDLLFRKHLRGPRLRKHAHGPDTEEQDRKAVTATIDVSDPPPFNLEYRLAAPFKLKLQDSEHKQAWMSQLRTSQDYEDQSNFDSWSRSEPRLVEQYPEDWALWIELIDFSRRRNGTDGVKATWNHMRSMELDIPTADVAGDQLWDRLMWVGDQDWQFTEGLYTYATDLKSRTGKSWHKFYARVMFNCFKSKPAIALDWHRKLKEDFEPRPEHYQALFEQALSTGKMPIFEEIYIDCPIPGLYETIVSVLCRRRRYREALKWHFIFIKADDLPKRIEDLTALLMYNKDYGSKDTYRQLLESFQSRQQQLMNPGSDRMGADEEVPPIAPSPLREKLRARLFATRILPVETILSALPSFKITNISATVLREILLRSDFDCQKMCEYLDHMKQSGLSLSKGKYTGIIVEASKSDSPWLLKSLAETDVHPDAFDDPVLQEDLLTMYYRTGDADAVERTMAVLTHGLAESSLLPQRENLMLRVHVRLDQEDEVRRILEAMKVDGTILFPASAKMLRTVYLDATYPGREGMAKVTRRNINPAIEAMKLCLDSGAFIPIEAWREIFRRLGMTGQLETLRNLALWVAERYLDPPPQDNISNTVLEDLRRTNNLPEKEESKVDPLSTSDMSEETSMFTETSPTTESFTSSPIQEPSSQDALPPLDEDARAEPMHEEHADLSPEELQLTQLFTTHAQRAFIAWGFHQDVVQQPRRGYDPKAHHKPESWTWGLYLLRDLKRIGVPVSDELVRMQCQRRMQILFGHRPVSGKINQRSRELFRKKYHKSMSTDGGRAIYTRYTSEMATIWGKGVFSPVHRLEFPKLIRERQSWRKDEEKNNTDFFRYARSSLTSSTAADTVTPHLKKRGPEERRKQEGSTGVTVPAILTIKKVDFTKKTNT